MVLLDDDNEVAADERVQQKWTPVLREAIKLAQIAYTYLRARSNSIERRVFFTRSGFHIA
jgi:hypothetical protein